MRMQRHRSIKLYSKEKSVLFTIARVNVPFHRLTNAIVIPFPLSLHRNANISMYASNVTVYMTEMTPS